ncbi:MAG TPA: CehA/McbA family metallohydrolase [Pyrinomonadaceae bacterium]|nr:CehA/McbA family metallohydrolase [Pyrinomonadaceae bacterium]
MPTVKLRLALVCLLAPHLLASGASAQWTNRYPKVANVNHHVYLEGYNLPTLNAGATDPAPSPDGRTLAVAARGWLWAVDLATREARRLTRGAGLDSRPAWSPDGKQLAFVRDDGRDTSVVVLDLASGRERVAVDTPALDLDPAFSRDGRALFYSSAEAGDLDIWRVELATGEKKRLTTDRGLELQPQPLPDDAQLLYLSKAGAIDSIVVSDLRPGGARRVLRDEGIASQTRPALKPDGRSLVANLPAQGRWQLWLMDKSGGVSIQLAHEARYPLTPAWSADGNFVYYAEPDADERFRVFRVAATGGAAEDVSPLSWSWGEPTARLVIRTRAAGGATNLPARLSVVDGKGHAVLPDAGQPRFDGQNGMVFFYSPGVTTAEVPPGEVRVVAARGFGVTTVSASKRVGAGETATIDLELPAPLWNPASEGWHSADLHSHLNYGGPYLLTPEDMVLDMRAEDLDLSTPQLANLHTRFMDIEWRGWRRAEWPSIAFAQEVRSHFLGHVSVVGADSLYWPWYYGPGYPVYDQLDLPNYEALRFARARGGINSYVHPVSGRNPFPQTGDPAGMPLELVPDALAGDVDTLEVACLWSDELGTSEAWYRLLNLGLAVAPSAGSDTMHNFFRTMAVGSTRVYAKPEGAMNLNGFLQAVRRGRSFVTNGPLVKFTAGGAEPGGVVEAAPGRSVEWRLDAWSAVPFERVEILVNGQVAWSGRGPDAAGHKTYSGRVEVPRGGWVAARVHGGASRWPVMDSYPFAHTAPVWFGRVGSSDADAARRAAQDLLRWMGVAEKRLNEGYAGAPAVRLRQRFADARRSLEARVK